MQLTKKRVKIIATLGPASDSYEIIRQMISDGLDVVRLNFSHGDHAWHQKNIELIKAIRAELGTSVAIMADLQGPKIRLTDFASGSCFFVCGAEVELAFGAALCTVDKLYINCSSQVFSTVKVGDTILLDDGKVSFQVKTAGNNSFKCIVHNEGYLTDRKGVNILGGGLNIPAITEKDLVDLEFVLKMGVDFIALSFVKTAEDIFRLRAIIAENPTKILAKIETSEAIANYQEIIQAADGIMVARGDLAVEAGAQKVPWLQKQLVTTASYYKKPSIVATQMMESMINASVPTRAEVSDVANAIIDGSDAVMLSAETAVGVDPVAVVDFVSEICLEANQHVCNSNHINVGHSVSEVVAWSAVEAAKKLEVDFLVALTETGSTALMFSKFGVNAPVLGLSRNDVALSHMALYRNVTPIAFDVMNCGPDIYREVVDFLKEQGYIKTGQKIIITKGWALGVIGETNSLVVLEV